MENVSEPILPGFDGRDLCFELTHRWQLHHHLRTFFDKLLQLRHMNSVIAALSHINSYQFKSQQQGHCGKIMV